jgi:hypothetical protein
VLGIHASPVEFVKELPRIHQSRPMRSDRTYDALTSRMVVRSPEGRIQYMIDGDLHETAGEVVVSIGPRVRLVTVQ